MTVPCPQPIEWRTETTQSSTQVEAAEAKAKRLREEAAEAHAERRRQAEVAAAERAARAAQRTVCTGRK